MSLVHEGPRAHKGPAHDGPWGGHKESAHKGPRGAHKGLAHKGLGRPTRAQGGPVRKRPGGATRPLAAPQGLGP